MRDKIVFFVLGAVLATIAYTIGDLEIVSNDLMIAGMLMFIGFPAIRNERG